MKSLKLDVLEQNQLKNQEMNALQGGGKLTCSCGCKYAGQGDGSSVESNMSANAAGGLDSEYPPNPNHLFTSRTDTTTSTEQRP